MSIGRYTKAITAATTAYAMIAANTGDYVDIIAAASAVVVGALTWLFPNKDYELVEK